MTKVPLTNGSGKWFDDETATNFSEDTWWNGSNHISSATGSQWEHQALYYTKSGAWVLNAWSQYQGVGETYDEITPEEATQWLIGQRHFDDIDELPEDVRQQIAAGIEAAEL